MPVENSENIAREVTEKINWRRLIITILLLIGISFGLAFLFGKIVAGLHLDRVLEFAWLAYLTVFLTSLISNLTIIAPVPFGLSILITVATKWNPALAAISATLGASIGELSGYYAGYLGRKVAMPGSALWHSRFEKWINRWGPWAIFVLAIQPVLPFDVAGLVAGAAKMPFRKFFPALLGGRLLKYLIFAYGGSQIIHRLPILSF